MTAAPPPALADSAAPPACAPLRQAAPAPGHPPAPEARPLTLAQLGAALAIENRVTPHPWTQGHFADSLRAGHYAQGLWRGNDLLGYCIAMPGHQEAHLLNIAIAPAHQRQGWARRLLAALIGWAREQQAQALWLEVRASNTRAQQLYLSLGFASTGRRRGYYPAAQGQREDAIVMRLPLHTPPTTAKTCA